MKPESLKESARILSEEEKKLRVHWYLEGLPNWLMVVLSILGFVISVFALLGSNNTKELSDRILKLEQHINRSIIPPNAVN